MAIVIGAQVKLSLGPCNRGIRMDRARGQSCPGSSSRALSRPCPRRARDPSTKPARRDFLRQGPRRALLGSRPSTGTSDRRARNANAWGGGTDAAKRGTLSSACGRTPARRGFHPPAPLFRLRGRPCPRSGVYSRTRSSAPLGPSSDLERRRRTNGTCPPRRRLQ